MRTKNDEGYLGDFSLPDDFVECSGDCAKQVRSRSEGGETVQYYVCVSDRTEGSTPCPPSNDGDCNCQMFKAKWPPPEGKNPKWEHVPKPEGKPGFPKKEVDDDTDYRYRCYCVKMP